MGVDSLSIVGPEVCGEELCLVLVLQYSTSWHS